MVGDAVTALAPEGRQQSAVKDGERGERQQEAEDEVDKGLVDDEVDRVGAQPGVNDVKLVTSAAEVWGDDDLVLEVRRDVVDDRQHDHGTEHLRTHVTWCSDSADRVLYNIIVTEPVEPPGAETVYYASVC